MGYSESGQDPRGRVVRLALEASIRRGSRHHQRAGCSRTTEQGILVGPQAPEAGVGATTAVARPLGERHVGDEIWSHPVRSAFGDHVDEGRTRSLAAAQLTSEKMEGGGIEAGAYLAGVAEPSRVVVPEEQRAELRPGAPRVARSTRR